MRDRIPWAAACAGASRAQRAGSSTRTRPSARALARRSPATQARRGEIAVSATASSACRAADDVVYGGAVKFALLDRALPNAPRDFNVLYLGSSALAARGAEARRPRATARRRVRLEPGRRRVPGLVRRRLGARERAARQAAARGRPRVLPERVLQAVGGPVLRRAAGTVGGAAQPGRHAALRPRRARGGGR